VERLLILGGTAWLGREVARQAVAAGVAVTCLARGQSGPVAEGAVLVTSDRDRPDAYDEVRGRSWDSVIEVSWQPDHVRSALEALADDAQQWTYVSSVSAYSDLATPGRREGSALVEPMTSGVATLLEYAQAKSGCEALTDAVRRDHSLLARVGLIGGPGDPTDRFGYWVSRFAQAARDSVLVPDAPDLVVQVVDVRDVASFLLACAGRDVRGPVNVVGESVPFVDLVAESARIAGFGGTVVPVSAEWLSEHQVQPWRGPRSLPLWLPLPDHAGLGRMSDARALSLGLRRRPLGETLADVLSDERARGLERVRNAGLTRAEEVGLLAEVRSP